MRSSTGLGSCLDEVTDCGDGTHCADFLDCAEACGTDQACVDGCATEHPEGLSDYRDLYFCQCDDCTEECADLEGCQRPECGVSYADPTCNECNEAACCAETKACTDDAACLACATDPNADPAACAANALLQAMRQCNGGSCVDECWTSCGFGNDGECGDCIHSCCDVSVACALDADCHACATGTGAGLECAGNEKLSAFFDCLQTCDGDPCGAGGGSAGGSGGTGGDAGTGAGGTATGGEPSTGGTATGGEPGTGGTATGGEPGPAGGNGSFTGGTSGDAGDHRSGVGADGAEDAAGCGCSTPGGNGTPSGGAAFAAFALGLVGLRRRSRRSAIRTD